MSGLPSGFLVEAVLKNCDLHCIPYYILQKGNHGSGVIMVKINMLEGRVKLHTQQRDFMNDTLDWVNALDAEEVEEVAADTHIAKAKDFDPDLWVIEIEDREGRNPFRDDF